MKIDTKFNRGDVVCFMSNNSICKGVIEEIEVYVSPRYTIEPTIVYKVSGGYHLTNPRILCATREEVAKELLNQC